MKKCCECKINKELKDFAKNKNIKDGLNNRCKVCCKNRNKNRYEKEKDKIKNQTKEICLEALIQGWCAFIYVKNET
jgi:hypothetical protein